jgi:hypothetical protein
VAVFGIAGTFLARHVGLRWDRSGVAGMTVVVGVVVEVRIVAIVPARAVDVIVVGVVVYHRTRRAHIVVIRRHGPSEGWTAVGGPEAQIGGRTIDIAIGEQVDALQVDGHVNLVTGVGIVAIQPDFVERGADLLGPHLVDKAVGGQFVLIAAVDHQLVLIVQVSHCPRGLVVSKIEDVVGGSAQGCYHQCQC